VPHGRTAFYFALYHERLRDKSLPRAFPHNTFFNHISDVFLSSFLLGKPSIESLATKSQVLLPFLSFLIYQFWMTACTSSLVLANTLCFPNTRTSDSPLLHRTLWNANRPVLLYRCPSISKFLVFIGSLQAVYHLTEKDIFNCPSFPPLCLQVSSSLLMQFQQSLRNRTVSEN